jgi:hypothetical protein
MGVDYHDFIGIMVLLVVNSTISFIEENNAGNAAAALMARLAPKAKVINATSSPSEYYLAALALEDHHIWIWCPFFHTYVLTVHSFLGSA